MKLPKSMPKKKIEGNNFFSTFQVTQQVKNHLKDLGFHVTERKSTISNSYYLDIDYQLLTGVRISDHNPSGRMHKYRINVSISYFSKTYERKKDENTGIEYVFLSADLAGQVGGELKDMAKKVKAHYRYLGMDYQTVRDEWKRRWEEENNG